MPLMVCNVPVGPPLSRSRSAHRNDLRCNRLHRRGWPEPSTSTACPPSVPETARSPSPGPPAACTPPPSSPTDVHTDVTKPGRGIPLPGFAYSSPLPRFPAYPVIQAFASISSLTTSSLVRSAASAAKFVTTRCRSTVIATDRTSSRSAIGRPASAALALAPSTRY